MRLTWLGWAGAELEADGATVVIDPLDDAGAVFAPLGELIDHADAGRLGQPFKFGQGRFVALAIRRNHSHQDARLADNAGSTTEFLHDKPSSSSVKWQ
jgi:L-ascorbate metabolism protein UlaG (beta-lactamase superfamily)